MTRTTLAVLIDALGWELVQRHGFLDDLCPQRTPVRTVLGYSSAAIPCLLTGEDPVRTGMWSLFYRTAQRSPFAWTRAFSWLPEPFYENRYARWLVRKSARAFSGYTGYFYTYAIPVRVLQQLDCSEKKSIYRAGSFDNGCRSLFDRLEERGVPYRSYSYHEGADEALVEKASSDLRSGRGSFVFVYLSELDAALHREVRSPDRVSALLRRYEGLVRRLHGAATQGHGEVDLHVCSDHGMTPIGEHFDLRAVLRTAGPEESRDYLGLFDSTMARFWFRTPAARDAVIGCLSAVPQGRVLTDDYLRDEGVLFEDRRYGELIFLMNPGTLLLPSDMGSRPVAGMHGFSPEDRHSTAMYMTNRTRPSGVRHLKDVVGAILSSTGGAG